ncbi:MAG: outer membrane lipoprotein-sorting protein [Pyrinomonadaceae bacterium]
MRKAKNPTFCLPMKRKLAFLFFALTLASCAGSANNSNDPAKSQRPTNGERGDEIVAEYLRRDAAPLRRTHVRFTITSEDGSVKVYELDSWRKQADDETSTLTQIVKPAEESDLATLTVESANKPTVVTTYASSMQDFRETDTNKMFFGGITAGELLGEWGKFDFRLLKEETAGDHQQYQLEGNLKKGAKGTVARMEVAMRADNCVPVQLRLFDSTDRQIRTFDITDFKTDDHGAYASKTIVDNPIYKTKTEIEILSREFPTSVDPSFFTREKLKAIAARAK